MSPKFYIHLAMIQKCLWSLQCHLAKGKCYGGKIRMERDSSLNQLYLKYLPSQTLKKKKKYEPVHILLGIIPGKVAMQVRGLEISVSLASL